MISTTGKADNTRVADRWTKSTGTLPSGEKYPDMTFHHQIPYNALWPLWNKLISSADPKVSQLPGKEAEWRSLMSGGARVCILTFMELIGIEQSEDLLERILEARHDGLALESDERDELAMKLLWTGWNIIEGPLNTLRADDPDENYDDFSRDFILLNMARPLLIATKVRELNTAILDFLMARKGIKAAHAGVEASDRKVAASFATMDRANTVEDLAKAEKAASRSINSRKAAGAQYLGKWDPYTAAIMNLFNAMDGVDIAISTNRVGSTEPLLRFTPNMWVKQASPIQPGKPWVLASTARVYGAFQSGIENIQAIRAATGL